MRKILHFCLLSIIILLLAACAEQQTVLPTPTAAVEALPATPDTNPEPDAYPMDEGGQMGENGYPAPGEGNTVQVRPQNVTPVAPLTAPEPEPGMASVSGVIYSYTSHMVVPGTQTYLTRAIGGDSRDFTPMLVGPRSEEGDIVFTTNDEGAFSVNNVPPGNYYLIVWAPYNWIPAQLTEEDTTPYLIELEEGQAHPTGILYVSWP
jgi:hypothetical protein